MKKLFTPLKGHPKLYCSIIFKSIFWALGSYIGVLFMQYIVGVLEIKNEQLFVYALFYLVGFYVVYEIINYISRHLGWVYFWFPFVGVLHRLVVPGYIALDNTATEKIGTGKTISTIEKGMYARADACMNIIEYSAKAIVSIVFASYFISQASWWYVLVYFGLLGVLMYINIQINKRVLIYRNKRRDWNITWTSHLVKLIMSKFEVLLSAKINHEVTKLGSYVENMQKYNLQMNEYMHWFWALPSIVLMIFRMAIYGIFGYGYLQGIYTLAQMTALLSMIILIEKTLYEIIEFYKDLTKNISDITKLRELLDTTPQMIGYDQGEKFIYQNGDIRLKDICFSYAEGKPIFDHFSLDIQGGKKTALVGLSGSGKTTLMKLIAGYMRADSGEVLVDGQLICWANPLGSAVSPLSGGEYNGVSLQSYFAHIGYLTQEPSVFDGTIRENLLYGITEDYKQKISEDAKDKSSEQSLLSSALSLAHCDFVYDLPEGLDTEIGEKGIRLSGGQRQRLAIAKIFLKNPQIILLDEPTSALDSLSEKLVSDAFHKLFEGRTVIIIAHRLQTVKEADEIIVVGQKKTEESESIEAEEKVNNGKDSGTSEYSGTSVVIERGTHAELSTAGGTYQEMLELQSGFNF